MTVTLSTMLSLGSMAPSFTLPDPLSGRQVRLSDFAAAPALVVVFMCNHCPYVKHVRETMASLFAEFQQKGVAVVGINANDVEAYPDDRPERMAEDAQRYHYSFPYLYDETQEVAREYHAACTPDFFVFDKERKLAYRGQMDDSRPGNGVPVTGRDLRAAVDALLEGKAPPAIQRPSMGCNIKWRTGTAPEHA